MARSIKIGDEITTSILNSVETTITANLLSGGEPNFAACKAVATRLSNYVAACEAHYNELQAQLKAEESKVSAVADLQAQLAELTAKLSELTEPKAPAKPKSPASKKPASKKSTTSKSAKPNRRKKTVGQRLAQKAGQGRKDKNTVLEVQQQAAFVSALPTGCPF